jgi:hypothetical protein
MTGKNTMENSKKANGMQKYRLYGGGEESNDLGKHAVNYFKLDYGTSFTLQPFGSGIYYGLAVIMHIGMKECVEQRAEH